MHELVLAPNAARTRCGIYIYCYYPEPHRGLTSNKRGPVPVSCCVLVEGRGPAITCEGCKVVPQPHDSLPAIVMVEKTGLWFYEVETGV